MVTDQMTMQKGQSLPKVMMETDRNQMTKAIPPRLPALSPHHIQRGRRAPLSRTMPIAASAPKAMAPTKELGTPSRFPCHTLRESPQDTRGLTSQTSSASGLRSRSSWAVMSSQQARIPMSAHTVSSQPNPRSAPERRSQVGRAEESSPVSRRARRSSS